MKEFTAEPLDIPSVTVAESPQWHENALWYCDIEVGGLLRFEPQDASLKRWTLDGALASIAPTDGGFIAGTSLGFEYLSTEGDRLKQELLHAPFTASPAAPMPGTRMNDGIADPSGRFWCGSIEPNSPQLGRLFCLDKGQVRVVRDGFRTLNGLAFSSDGRRLYVSDSHPSVAKVWTMAIDADGMPLEKPQLFANLSEFGGRPDGATVDEDGGYWIAASDSGRVLRLDPKGRPDMVLHVPTTNPTNITFGGPDFRTAFITSLKPGGKGNEFAGRIFAVDLPVAGRKPDRYIA
ncbi:SMP-30/gluconolactonase/LRE family protein [Agrobacterium vitis]|uniref:SMP-30/gluconolactonase/LRE family protein n=1 Tax=Agrobacterium vitis TaxID=373 RepID=UPI00203653CC|nr:SMP-30/gluconolactonase/LRE family protein [Agrobacterium vitis]MCM2450132.1 SMP-30/gluconolactonase/LRE family protein [Agrobacterium vitis]